jgi:hypothetical protein
MSENVPAEQVIPIDPDGKYVMIFPMRLTDDEMMKYREVLDNWLEGPGTFLIADGGVQVIRLEKYDEKARQESEQKEAA